MQFAVSRAYMKCDNGVGSAVYILKVWQVAVEGKRVQTWLQTHGKHKFEVCVAGVPMGLHRLESTPYYGD